ncbi:MAG: ATP-binding protein [Aggregatilineales bacterium]
MAIQPLEVLRQTFPGIQSAQELAQLAQLARQVTYPPDTILCREGAYEKVLYLICEGEVIITKRFDMLSEERLVLRRATAGDYFGEMAIISDAPRSATVTTTTETTVLEIDQDVFRTILERNADLAMQMVRQTFERLRQNDRMTLEELRKAFETLEKLDRAKLDFIEVTAHELRTPLTIMRGYASMMLADPAVRENPLLREMIEGIANGSQRLHEIVNNMLDVQRIDLEQVTVAAVPVSLPLVLRGAEMQFKEALQQRRLTLLADFGQSDGESVYIEADPGLLSKTFYHILMNAIKYTPDGGTIRITLRYEDHPILERVAHVQIADTGIGIDPQYHTLIFEKFYRLGDVQLHSSGKTAFKAGGPGLGLAIARGAVLAHGGEIWVESEGHDEVNFKGSIFHVVLPVQAAFRQKMALLRARYGD